MAIARIGKARAAQQRWQQLPVAERRGLFLNVLQYLEQNLDAHASRISGEMFKPLRQARGELEAGIAKLRRVADMANAALQDTSVAAKRKPFSCTMRRGGKGLIYTIAPWNYPFFTALNSIGPAALAGNAVVLKRLVGQRASNLTLREPFLQASRELFGLTSSVFTGDSELQNRVINAAQCGTVFIDWCNDVHAEVAWSGWGHSRNSMPALSDLGFEALTRTQSIVKAMA